MNVDGGSNKTLGNKKRILAVAASPIAAANAPHANPSQEKNFLREIVCSAIFLSFAARVYLSAEKKLIKHKARLSTKKISVVKNLQDFLNLPYLRIRVAQSGTWAHPVPVERGLPIKDKSSLYLLKL